jgi:mono/diheme cytochrome c family protein
MNKIIKFVGVVAAVGTASLLAIIFVPAHRTPAQIQVAPDNVVVSGSGEYVMRTGDCVACHTAPGGTPFAGGLAIESPFGDIYSTNITPDPEHGIGNWTLDDFRAAMIDGVRHDGQFLYPAMPFANYRKMSEADIASLYDYLMNDVDPVASDPPQTDLSFPFNQRWGIRMWKWIAMDEVGFEPRYDDPVLDRGAYLVEGPAHCSSCHTPRNLASAQAGYGPEDSSYLSGSVLNGWAAPALRGPNSAPALWEEVEMVAYLQTGRNAHAGVAGEMASVIEHSLQYLTDEDVTAMARYLHHVATDENAADTLSKSKADREETAAMLLAASPDMDLGARLYLDNCSACHFSSGAGANGVFPDLVGNSTALADEAGGFLNVILNGATMPSTEKRPAALRMPGFRDRLSDEEVAALATFVRQAWGNGASRIDASTVENVRAEASNED